MQPQPLPATHHTDWQYANWNQATAAGAALARALMGQEDMDLNCKVHCATCCLTFGLSVALPHEPEPSFAKAVKAAAKKKAPSGDKSIGKLLEEHFAKASADPNGEPWGAVPWAILVPILLKLLERFLNKGK